MIYYNVYHHMGFPNDSVDKESAWNPEDIGPVGSIHGSRRSPGVGNGNTRQYSCLKNPMDRVTWQATVQRITKSQKQLKATMLTQMLSSYGSKLECFFDPGAFLINFPVTKSFLSSKERSRPDIHSDDFFFFFSPTGLVLLQKSEALNAIVLPVS